MNCGYQLHQNEKPEPDTLVFSIYSPDFPLVFSIYSPDFPLNISDPNICLASCELVIAGKIHDA